MVDVDILRNRLEQYRAVNIAEEDHAMREILQEYVLAALTRTDFFAKAAFHGGTHLRIFHGLRRFSEDLLRPSQFLCRETSCAALQTVCQGKGLV